MMADLVAADLSRRTFSHPYVLVRFTKGRYGAESGPRLGDLLKQVLSLFEETLSQRAFIAITQLSKFLQFCLLCCREMRWHFDVYAHMQVAVAVTLDILHSLSFEPEHGSGLSAGWNFQGCFPVQRRHFDIVAQRRLNKAYRHFTKQIVAIALAQQGVTPPRPLTHDLFRDVLAAFGRQLLEVRITAMRDMVFYAELVFDGGLQVSARPSDAIALALRTGATIYGAEEVLAESSILIPDEQEDEVEVERFREFLDQVSPEDFGA